jgi:protein SCO1/2
VKNSPPAPLNHDGRLFLLIAILVAVFFSAGGIFLILALNHHESAAGIQPDHPRQLVDFSLTDRTGRTVTRADLAGKILVVDFLYTSCSLTCPVVNRRMSEIQQLTADQPDVRFLSITVDPRTDTPDHLMKYGASFGADTNRWYFLTGEKTNLYHLIATSFLAQDLDDPFVYMPGNFSHTDRIAVVDAHGQVQLYFDGLRRETTAQIVKEIAHLRKNDL